MDTVKQKKLSPAASTQLYLNIAEIRDNVIVLKNGGVRVILKTSSVNFNLKSEAEQEALIAGYQGFLNTLEFPIQIVARSKKLDIFKYLEHLKNLSEKQTNPLIKKQTVEYREYIKKLIEYADIMEKEFFVVVPYDPPRAQKISIFGKLIEWLTPKDSIAKIRQRHKEFDQLKKGIMNRVNGVKIGLENIGLRVDHLETSEIIKLFYTIYNPLIARNEKIDDMSALKLEPY